MAGDGGIHGTGREMLRLLCLGMSQCMKSLGKGTYVRVCMCYLQLRFMSTCRIRNNHFKCKGKIQEQNTYIYIH